MGPPRPTPTSVTLRDLHQRPPRARVTAGRQSRRPGWRTDMSVNRSRIAKLTAALALTFGALRQHRRNGIRRTAVQLRWRPRRRDRLLRPETHSLQMAAELHKSPRYSWQDAQYQFRGSATPPPAAWSRATRAVHQPITSTSTISYTGVARMSGNYRVYYAVRSATSPAPGRSSWTPVVHATTGALLLLVPGPPPSATSERLSRLMPRHPVDTVAGRPHARLGLCADRRTGNGWRWRRRRPTRPGTTTWKDFRRL